MAHKPSNYGSELIEHIRSGSSYESWKAAVATRQSRYNIILSNCQIRLKRCLVECVEKLSRQRISENWWTYRKVLVENQQDPFAVT